MAGKTKTRREGLLPAALSDNEILHETLGLLHHDVNKRKGCVCRKPSGTCC